MSQHGPFAGAHIEGDKIVIQCAGIGQAFNCLSLVKAAPALLEALEGMLKPYVTAREEGFAMSAARTAIALAKEGQS